MQVCISVGLTNLILAAAILVVSFTHATIRRNTRPCKKICRCARQKRHLGDEDTAQLDLKLRARWDEFVSRSSHCTPWKESPVPAK